jgi:hypothetical protein
VAEINFGPCRSTVTPPYFNFILNLSTFLKTVHTKKKGVHDIKYRSPINLIWGIFRYGVHFRQFMTLCRVITFATTDLYVQNMNISASEVGPVKIAMNAFRKYDTPLEYSKELIHILFLLSSDHIYEL